TYSVGVGAATTHYPRETYSLSISFGCDPDRAEELAAVVMAQIDTLQAQGPEALYIQKAKERRRRRHELRLRENGYWLSLLDMTHFHQIDPRLALDYLDYVEGLDAEMVQGAIQRYCKRENHVRVVLLPESYIE
ncbi:MAG: hypothetical protein VX293_06240, partial [Candidatus Latescibacterota bacterium]|nr:hypothetical protein [Candidatus Latescibacterota bacterium]